MKKKRLEVPSVNLVAMEKVAAGKKAESNSVMEMITRMSIKNPGEFESAARSLAEIKTTRAELDEQRKAGVNPLNGVVKLINGWFQPAIKKLDEAEAALKKKMLAYQIDAAAKRDLLITRAGKTHDQEKRISLLDAAEDHAPTEVAGVQTRSTWVGEVEDASAIPRRYMIPDVKALAALTKATGGDPEIPGWRAWEEKSLAVSVDRVRDSEG